MKKFITAALLVILVTGTAMANRDIENTKVTRVFNTEYPGADHISYKATSGHITVNFTIDKQNMQAFYDYEGNKIASSRTIQLKSLPFAAQRIIASKYSDYTPTEAIEFDSVQEGLCYYVSVQNDTQKIILNITSQGDVSVFKKSKL